MSFRTSKTLLVAMMALIGIALVLSAPAVIAAKKAPMAPASGCPMMSGGNTCAMGASCPIKTTKGSACMLSGACGALTATVTSINHKDGTLTLQVKPIGGNSAALKAAIGKLKVGDKVSVNAMVGKDGKLAACPISQAKAKH